MAMADDRYLARVPQPLQRGTPDWPHFVARTYAQPVWLLAVPYRRDQDQQLQPAQEDGQIGPGWPKACKWVDFAPDGKGWSALASGDGQRFAADLYALGLEPLRCDGALILFIVEAHTTGLFGAAVTAGEGAPTQRPDDDTLRALVGALSRAERNQACLLYTSPSPRDH
jgi:hypothetical protein